MEPERMGRVMLTKTNPLSEEEVIKQHERMIFSVVNQFKWAVLRGDVAYEDLVSEATIGLIKAIRRYDPEQYNTRFSTFAIPYMRGAIQIFLTRRVPILKVRRPVYELTGRILKRKLKDASPFEISHALHCTPQEAQNALRYLRESEVSSLQKPIDEDGNTVMDCFGRTADFTEIEVTEFIATLNPKQRQVVELRLEGRTQMEIADVIRVSQMQVCRILQQIGGKLQLFWGLQMAR
jgi:RNA polymerase sigma factor (sigma-70 family)